MYSWGGEDLPIQDKRAVEPKTKTFNFIKTG